MNEINTPTYAKAELIRQKWDVGSQAFSGVKSGAHLFRIQTIQHIVYTSSNLRSSCRSIS